MPAFNTFLKPAVCWAFIACTLSPSVAIAQLRQSIDEELLSSMVMAKQEEIKQRAIRDLVRPSLDGSSLATYNTVLDLLDVLLKEKNKSAMTRDLVRIVGEHALAYATTWYFIKYQCPTCNAMPYSKERWFQTGSEAWSALRDKYAIHQRLVVQDNYERARTCGDPPYPIVLFNYLLDTISIQMRDPDGEAAKWLARNGRTRMRVRAIHGSNPGTLTCAAWDHGEVEDYYVHVSGGQGTYTYNWTAGTAVAEPTQASTTSLPLAQDGLFLVSVMNEQGCFATGSVQVTVQRPPQVIGLVASDTSVCAGSDVQLQLAVAPSAISCVPGQLFGECATDEHIVHVSFGSIVNPSGCSLPGGYEDHTAKATTVAAGATGLTGAVTIAQAFTGDQVGVWIDWDQDGDLTDAGEAAAMSGGPANWTFSINVPANARDGATRMRVRLTYQATPQPCGTSNYGETEDYSVIVTGGTQPVGYVWSPIDALNSTIVPNPQVNDLEFTTNYTVTVTGPTGCSSQAGITLLVDGDDADGDGMGDCTDPCPAIAGGPGSSCDDGDATTLNDVIGANCTCTGTPAALLQVRMVLEGPYASATGLMNDALRTLPDFPLTEPYTALGYVFTGGGGETIATGVLQVSGSEAIVDWVVLELRDRLTPSDVVASRAALLQRDGDVVDLDGTSPVAMAVEPNGYLLAVRHRNHLGVMAADPVPLFGDPMDVDLSIAGTTVHGTAARKDISGAQALWAGDVTFNGLLQYVGAGNDRDPILVRIGGSVPTNTVSGYFMEDVDLDGTVKYVGSNNDRDPILVNVGGSVPTNTRAEQLP